MTDTNNTDTMTDDTDDEVRYQPPLTKVIRGLLADYGPVADDLLVSMTHTETGRDAATIRAVLAELESVGHIYNAAGIWKLTHR